MLLTGKINIDTNRTASPMTDEAIVVNKLRFSSFLPFFIRNKIPQNVVFVNCLGRAASSGRA